jgi:hypothetical protein
LSYAEETRLFAAIGCSTAMPSPAEVVAAAESQKHELESTTRKLEAATSTRQLEAARDSEIAALRRELELLTSQNRLAAKERELDRRDEAERREIASRLKVPLSHVR